jgi:protein O-GlcNAc transferase
MCIHPPQACPTYAEAYNNLGVLQRDIGAIADAINSYSRCLEITPDSRNAGQNRLLALNYMYHGEDALVCDAHVEWGARFAALHTPLPPLTPGLDVDLDPERRLHVGYISPDLFTHSVSYFAHAPLGHHR